MRTKFLYIVAMVILVSFTACENNTPFDKQTANDDPIILRPYNESGAGTSFDYYCANPDVPLYDSVVVTPTAYTTVKWYLDDQLVYTGKKINMCFPTGKYKLLIEAVTTAGKRTTRFGFVTVGAFSDAPYASGSADGVHIVPGVEMEIPGKNMSKVAKVMLTSDLYSKEEVCSCVPTSKDDGAVKVTLPEVKDGTYYLRFVDGEGKIHGSGNVQIQHGAYVLSGYEEFTPQQEWVISGVNLEHVASVKLDDAVITAITVTSSAITLTAPNVEAGMHTLSIMDKTGAAVPFITHDGIVSQVKTKARDITAPEIDLWKGSTVLKWDAERIKVTKEQMAEVSAGDSIFIEFSILPSGDPEYYDPEKGDLNEYHALRIVTDWDGANDVLPQEPMDGVSSPFAFVYTADRKSLVESKGSMSLVGWGCTITRIYTK